MYCQERVGNSAMVVVMECRSRARVGGGEEVVSGVDQ